MTPESGAWARVPPREVQRNNGDTPALSVDRIDVVTGSSGATTGFPSIAGDSDLNVPGPFNKATTGEVTNVHQFRFHLDNGASSDLTPKRHVRATFDVGSSEIKFPKDERLPGGVAGPPAPGGYGGVLDHPDGPPAHEILRPTGDSLAVADAPGIRSLSSAQYPFKLRSDFTLKVVGGGTDIAQVKYDVFIEKKDASDIPNTQNRLVVKSKDDLVRKRSL